MSDFGLRRLNPVSVKYREMLLQDIDSGRVKIESVTHCMCCNGTSFEELLVKDRFDLPFGSNLCVNCGLIVTSPRIKQGSLVYYYDKYYHPLNYGKESLERQDSLYGSQQGIKIFDRLKSHIQSSRIDVLEIGAGVGNVLNEFRDKAAASNIDVDVLGTEYSQQCIEKCQANDVSTIFGDASTVLELNRTFDLIILSHVFEHFIDLNAELAKLKKLLKVDGIVYIEVPGVFKNHLKHYYNFSFLGYSVHAHMYNFTLKSLENVLSSNGFSMLEGDEEVFGVFKFTGRLSECESNAYDEIKYYLNFLQENQEYALDQHKLVLSYKALLVSKSKEIESKSKEIESKAEKIEVLSEAISQSEVEITKNNTTLQMIGEAKRVLDSHNTVTRLFAKYKAYKNLQKVIDGSIT